MSEVIENPFKKALKSAFNLVNLVKDSMYGTPERTKITYIAASGMFVLGIVLTIVGDQLDKVCRF